MKKISAIFLLSILLVFSGCNQKTDNTVNTQSSSESTDASESIDTETLETIAAELQACVMK